MKITEDKDAGIVSIDDFRLDGWIEETPGVSGSAAILSAVTAANGHSVRYLKLRRPSSGLVLAPLLGRCQLARDPRPVAQLNGPAARRPVTEANCSHLARIRRDFGPRQPTGR